MNNTSSAPLRGCGTKVLGEDGERIACTYLCNLGFKIYGRNVRFERYEIDIIAWDPKEKMVVFVEVKTRKTHNNNYPIHTAIGKRKRRAMRIAVDRWTARHDYAGPGRTDLLSVHEGKVVEHIQSLGSDFY